jgi:predicted protein tyrosine phosphatase
VEILKDPETNTPVVHFLCEAIGQTSNFDYKRFGQNIQVEFKVNGQEVPVSSTLDVVYNLMEKTIRKDLQEEYKSKLDSSRFHKLQQLFDDFEWQLEAELSNLFAKE